MESENSNKTYVPTGSAAKDAPVRLCCLQRHWGAVCPDGKVMCQLCYRRYDIKDLTEDDGVPIDVCRRCSAQEI